MGLFSSDPKPCTEHAFLQDLVLKQQKTIDDLTAQLCQLADPAIHARLAAAERAKVQTQLGAEKAREPNKPQEIRAWRPSQFRQQKDLPSTTKDLTPMPNREAR